MPPLYDDSAYPGFRSRIEKRRREAIRDSVAFWVLWSGFGAFLLLVIRVQPWEAVLVTVSFSGLFTGITWLAYRDEARFPYRVHGSGIFLRKDWYPFEHIARIEAAQSAPLIKIRLNSTYRVRTRTIRKSQLMDAEAFLDAVEEQGVPVLRK